MSHEIHTPMNIIMGFAELLGGEVTGLGLTITREMVRLLKGELSLVSKEGDGSVFSLVVPVGVVADAVPETDTDGQYEESVLP